MTTTCRTHIWTAPEEGQWTCVACLETTPTCVVERPSDDPEGHPTGTALLICQPCLDTEHRTLDDITKALGHWQHQPRSIVPAIRYDRDRIHGNSGRGDKPDNIDHPSDIVNVLWSWVDMWSETTGTPASGNPIDYLKTHTLWAAQNPATSAWDDWRKETRQLRHAARRLSGLLPHRQHGPCVHCGGDIVRDWADNSWQPRVDGLSDELRCTGCGLTWGNHGAWNYTNRHTLQLLPDIKPDALVTIDDARQIFPTIPAPTWRKWRERDTDQQHMPEHGTDVRGRPLYRLADLTALANRRDDDTRPGRKAG